MNILGLNAYHGDSAACVVRDGQLIAAAEEERFRRIKHWAGLPTQAVAYCLGEAGVTLSDIDHVAINRQPGVNNWRRLGFVLSHRPDPRLVLNRIRNRRAAVAFEDALQAAFPAAPLRARIHRVDHHLAHLASAFCVSPFDEAVCVSVDGFGDFASAAWGRAGLNRIQIDGRVYFPHSLGIFYSAITQLIGFPHFGDEYKVMGLAPYGEPKHLDAMRQIVLLQPDGTYRLNLGCFRHHIENVSYSWNDCAPEVGQLYTPELERLLGPARQPGEPLEQRQKDIARSAQAMYEEALFALLNNLHPKYNCPNLALAGGCAMNSVANGKILERTPFKRLYLPAAAGDAGGAIGAALVVWNGIPKAEDGRWKMEDGEKQKVESRKQKGTAGRGQREEGREDGGRRTDHETTGLKTQDSELKTQNCLPNGRFHMLHAYVGPEFAEADLAALLTARGLLPNASTAKSSSSSSSSSSSPSSSFSSSSSPSSSSSSPPSSSPPSSEFAVAHYSNADALCAQAAGAIADGKVVGWFQGRMEWGPRALGNRSILGDPRRADMKAILNAKIKRRESFRPFAPSILREAVPDWFETDDDVPFMMQVFRFRPGQRARVPAVCHVDGSGRLHTVTRDANPLYYRLLEEFSRLTGVPMVLNTSFNENEPVVCRPEEALDCFLRTRMDVLVLGRHFIEREPGAEE